MFWTPVSLPFVYGWLLTSPDDVPLSVQDTTALEICPLSPIAKRLRQAPPLSRTSPNGTVEGSEETLFEAPASDYGTEVHEAEEENSRTQERGHKQQSQEGSDGPERGGSSGDRGERPPSPQATSSTDGLSEGTDDTAGMDQRERSSTSRFVTSIGRRFPNPGMFIVLPQKGMANQPS